MAQPKLDEEQRVFFISLIAAGYRLAGINALFQEKSWPELTSNDYRYYKQVYVAEATDLRKLRYVEAAEVGLRLRDERIIRLIDLIETIEPKVLQTDARGRYPLLSEYRMLMDQLSGELGQKITKSELTGKDGKDLVITMERYARNRAKLEQWEKATFGEGGTAEQETGIDG